MISNAEYDQSIIRNIAQSDPVPKLTQQYGEFTRMAKYMLADLTRILRHVDESAATLAEHGITVSVDLGPIGNAAAAARRDLEKQRDGNTFELPR